MKNIKVILLLLFFIMVLSFTLSSGNTVYAEDTETTDTEKDLDETVNDSLNKIELNEFEAFFQELENSSLSNLGTSIKQMINDIINNKSEFSFYTFANVIFKGLLSEFLNILPLMVSIIIIAIFYGISSGLSSGFSKASTNQIIFFVCYGAIITILGYTVVTSVSTAKNTIELMDRLIEIAFPILLTFTSALGGAGSVAVYQPMMAIMSTVMIKIINNIIFPLFFATIVFSIMGNITDNIKLEKLTKTTKSIAEWTLGILFSLFIAFISAQGITGATFDTIAVKSAKFALTSYVPILGGYLSEGFDLVMASCVLLKNAVGLCAIILLFFVIALPVIKVLVLIFTLRLASAIIEPISDSRISGLLYNVSKNLMLLVVILLGLAFLIFIMIMLIIYTCNFGVI